MEDTAQSAGFFMRSFWRKQHKNFFVCGIFSAQIKGEAIAMLQY
ncbi:hypothetical protein GLGR_1681 [Leminorella grimontii ATCC 33999 = DSM 5078]|nr:hypothetical protein GLGR_1681 [Leminorella grimontii ATCC 33999 = DSM 5078]